MLMYFILGTLAIWLLLNYPIQIIMFISILYILYVISRPTGILNPDKIRTPTMEGYTDEDGVTDWEGLYKHKREEEMKPNFRDDPEWKEKSAEVREIMRKARIESDIEDQEVINKELNEIDRTFWQKTR